MIVVVRRLNAKLVASNAKPSASNAKLVVCALLACVGCGALTEPDDPGAPLFVLKLRIKEIEEGVEVVSPRAAFFWSDDFVPGGFRAPFAVRDHEHVIDFISQDVPVNPGLSLRFSLGFFDLPSRALDRPEQEPIAVGAVVIYDDRNGNEALDLLPADAPAPIDAIYGPKENYRVVFLDHGDYTAFTGGLDGAASSTLSVSPGFHTFVADELMPAGSSGTLFGAPIDAIYGPKENYRVVFLDHGDYTAFTGGLDGAASSTLSVSPGFHTFVADELMPAGSSGTLFGAPIASDEELPVTLHYDAEQESWMCREKPVETVIETLVRATPAEIPSGSEITCESDRRSLEFRASTRTRASVCGEVTSRVLRGHVSLEPNQTPPVDWPCP